MPTISTKKSAKRAVSSRKSMERETFVFLLVAIIGGASFLLHAAVQGAFIKKNRAEIQDRMHAFNDKRLLLLMELDERLAVEADLVKKSIEEKVAENARITEFDKRKQLDSAYAKSPLEKKMLEMKRIGEDAGVPDNEALEKICAAATPPSKKFSPFVAVDFIKKKGFDLKIAYPCESLRENSEIAKWPDGYYREERMVTAGMVKDILGFGQGRQIASLLIACQQEQEGAEPRNQFMVEVTTSSREWLKMRTWEVEKTWKVLADDMKKIAKEL